MLDQFTKRYAGHTYAHTATIRHEGKIIAFALAAEKTTGRPIFVYSVLDLSPSNGTGASSATAKGPFDVNYWQGSPQDLRFPDEIAALGYGVADQTTLPVHKKGNPQPEQPGTKVADSEKDPFLSTTARLTAMAPFQVLSDGRYVYLFRQAIGRDDPNAVIERDRDNEVVTDAAGKPVPLVDSTLLVDRFVLAGNQLQNKREVRFQRSRSKSRPQSRKDSLGDRDLDGNPFVEPTLELRFVSDLAAGRFTLLLVPTLVAEIQRWQIFAHNRKTGLIDCYGIERSPDGLFNLRGSQFYTSPDPMHQKDVFEAKPGIDPFTGEDLIPIVSTDGQAESALSFDGKGDHVDLGAGIGLGTAFTLEAWIFPERPDGTEPQALITSEGSAAAARSNRAAGPGLWIERQTRLRIGFGDGTAWNECTTTSLLSPQAWNHVAVSFDGSAFRVFINGRLRNKIEAVAVYVDGVARTQAGGNGAGEPAPEPLAGKTPANTAVRYFGAGANSFSGRIDEIRLWRRPRSERELRADMNQRLHGRELGLQGYWRFDEGSGSTVYDQTDNGTNGALAGGTWITSDAPIGEGTSLSRSSFRIASRAATGETQERTFESGPTALLYYQQAEIASGYDSQKKGLKQNARVMLAVATGRPGGDKNEIAAIDLGVSAAGKLALLPDVIRVPVLETRDAAGLSINQRLDELSDLEGRAYALGEDLVNLQRSIDGIAPVAAILDHTLADPIGDQPQIPDGEYRYLDQRVSAFRAAARSSAQAEAEVASLDAEFAAARVAVYQDRDYSGRQALYGTGSIGTPGLREEGFDDLISSLRVPEALQVTAYEDDHSGRSRTFEADTSWVGDDWNDVISSFDVQENAHFAARRAEAGRKRDAARDAAAALRAEIEQARNSLQARLAALAGERTAKEAERTTIRTKLAGIASELRSGVDVPMQLVHVDAQGLTISGGVLGFAWTKDTPKLFDSATGSLALYFRGTDDQFFVTYYTTLTERARYPLVAENGNEAVVCQARSTDLEMDKLTIAVDDGDDGEHCSVSIAGAEIEESWSAVPRDPEKFIRVLSGAASQREFIGSGTIGIGQGQVQGLSVPAGVRRDVPAGSTLMAGRTRVTVGAAVARGGSSLPITTDASAIPTEELPVFYLEYDYDLSARTTKVPADLYNGSLLVQPLPATGGSAPAGARIANQRVVSGATLSSRWTAESPGSTLTFDGAQSHAHRGDPARLSGFDPANDLTMEAWLKPGTVTDIGRVLRHLSDASGYTLGLQYDRAPLELDGARDHVDLGDVLSPGGATWMIELWFRCDRTDHDHILYNKENVYEAGVRDGFLQYAWAPTWDWCGGQTFAVVPGQWYHAAVVYDGHQQTLYRNGQPVFSRAQSGPIGSGTSRLLLGARGDTSPRDFFQGAIDEVRFWQQARTADQIRDNLRKVLKGDEPDLAGYWRFEDVASGVAPDLTSGRHDGAFKGAPRSTVLYTVFAGINQHVVRSRDSFAVGSWTHLAATFNQSYGLEFDGESGYLDCGADNSLDLSGDLSIEISLEVDAAAQTRGLLSKGKPGDGNAGKVPYALSLDSAHYVLFSFEDTDGIAHVFRSSKPVGASGPQRVAVTRKRESVAFSLGGSGFYSVTWDDIRSYIEGAEAGLARYAVRDDLIDDAAELARHTDSATMPADVKQRFEQNAGGQTTFTPTAIGRNDAALEIGRAFQSRDSAAAFKGVLNETRLWNTALKPDALNRVLDGTEQGLAAWWRFEDRIGNTATDTLGRNHGTFNGAITWVKDPDPRDSRLVLYRDGQSLEVDDVSTAAQALAGGAGRQFTLGATRSPAGFGDYYQGEIEELRIWQTARTQEQIQDNLFRRLTGEQEDLIAYYSFDATDATQLLDQGFRGNHLTLEGTSYVLSTAPIGPDTPEVRSALAGVKTAFHGKIESQPAVEEYGDLQVDAAGNLIGTFKRCYSVIQGGHWNLITGFKVGDLSTEWVGQVQFAPQLIGYVEGAPPVPSENLTATGYVLGEFSDYTGASSVEFTQAESVRYTYATSKDQGFDLSVDLKLGFVLGTKIAAGLGLETEVEDLDNVIGLHTHFDQTLSWLNQATTGVGRNTTAAVRMELRGIVENADAVTYPAIGRRFAPDNMGMALVKSETADVFALRLKHNNALVSFQMRPNPDIPPDRNIITFPINPRYVKQGTLDGKIGFEPDPDYPNARTYSSDTSYFKPLEAYALKNQIEREAAELRSRYQGYDASGYGRATPPPGQGEIEPKLRSPEAAVQQHNLVNSYVWTAAGGLFAESEDTIDSHQEVLGGSYAFKGMAGIYTDFTFKVLAGVKFELDALLGGHLNRTVTKSDETDTAFGLAVDLGKVESDVYLRDQHGQLIMDLSIPGNPKPRRQPGRVDAYRFMTYYLEPKTDYFEAFFNKVVDPLWLEESDDPNAMALREARQESKKPPCWRILHRVTYVSRVLPSLNESAPPSLEKTLQTLDIDSNYELIRQLEPFVRDKLASAAEFGKAIEDTVKVYLPELQPHLFEIKQYMSLYFGIADGLGAPSADGDAFGQVSLVERVLNQPPIVNAGPDQVVGKAGGAPVVVDLEGAVIDDRFDKAEQIFVTWETSGGDGSAVHFDAPHAMATKASFARRGLYVLRLTGDDGSLAASDEMTVTVNEPPIVDAGPAPEVKPGSARQLLEQRADNDPIRKWLQEQLRTDPLLCAALLAGQLQDDGLGNPQRDRVVAKWTKVSGPGDVTFADDKALSTLAAFSKAGHYLLRLSVDNGSFSMDDEVNVAVAVRATAQLQALYTFQEADGATVRDVAGAGAPLDLTIADPAAVRWIAGGLEITGPTTIASAGAIGRLTDAIKASGELTLEAWLKPAQPSQAGLGRIVTLSSGATARNVTLGQAGARFHAGVRTSTTNANASDRALTAGSATTEHLSHVVCTRDKAGLMRLYVDGQRAGERQVGGDLSTWDTTFRLALGNELNAPSGAERAWLGALHLVAIYSRALNADEVEQNRLFGPDADLAPVIFAGPDQVVDSAGLPAAASLSGAVTQDRPTPGAQVRWRQIAGPGEAMFDDEAALATHAHLPQKGRYLLRLTADDGTSLTSDDLAVVVNTAPVVRAGTTAHLAPPGSLRLAGELVDDGLGEPTQGQVATRWAATAGPGKVTFADASALNTTANFTAIGQYELKLTADNRRLQASATVTVFVHQAPVIGAEAPAIVTLTPEAGARVQLTGKVVSSGLGDPHGVVATSWTTPSGPAPVAFEPSGTVLSPTAVFTASGRYTLRLTVDNGHLSTQRELKIILNQPPVVDAGPDQIVTLPAVAVLDATVGDDGLPEDPGRVSLKWSQVSGPAGVVFADPGADCTTATFPTEGTYGLQVTTNDGAASTSDIVQIQVRRPPRIGAGLQALYRFDATAGAVVRDVSGVGAALDLTIADERKVHWSTAADGPSLTISGPTLIESGKAAGKIIAAIKASNALTIEAWITPDQKNPTEGAPARIVTLSHDQNTRNFTLGEEGQHLTVRLRTSTKTADDLNGTAQVLEGGHTRGSGRLHVVYTADLATAAAALFVNGAKVGGRALQGGFQGSWSDDFHFALANELNAGRAWLGQYHLVALYDRALSEPEVAQNYYAGLP